MLKTMINNKRRIGNFFKEKKCLDIKYTKNPLQKGRDSMIIYSNTLCHMYWVNYLPASSAYKSSSPSGSSTCTIFFA